jgi:hypothetical protein
MLTHRVMRAVVWCLLCAGLLSGMTAVAEGPALLPATELDALLLRVENDLRDLRSLQTEFVQKKHLSIFVEPVESKGMLLFRRPKDIRFDIIEPFKSTLIVSSGAVARYECAGGKWRKLNSAMNDAFARVTEHLVLWMQGRLREARQVYSIAATAGPEPTIILTPTQPKFKDFIKTIEIRIAFQPTRVAALTIREPNDDYTEIRFASELRNQELPMAYFGVDAPVPAPIAPGDSAATAPQSAPTASQPK